MPDDTILCGRPGADYCVTVEDYKKWGNDADGGWSKKPDFIRRRLFERYIDPVKALDLHRDTKECKHGFYMMAINCLLIETLVSYWRGWETTESFKNSSGRQIKGKSAKAFKMFFRIEPRFHVFRSSKFYRNVRCGILHQGETTGGWMIERSGPLFDGKHRINAARFHTELRHTISDYALILKNPPVGTKWRRNFDKKMKATIANCEP